MKSCHLFVDNNKSLSFSIDLELLNWLLSSHIRVHSRKWCTNSDCQIRHDCPLLQDIEVFSSEWLFHCDYLVGWVVPCSVDFIYFWLRITWFLSKSIMILLAEMLDILILMQMHGSDSMMCQSWLLLHDILNNEFWLFTSWCIVTDTSIHTDSSTCIQDALLWVLDHSGKKFNLFLECLFGVLEFWLGERIDVLVSLSSGKFGGVKCALGCFPLLISE